MATKNPRINVTFESDIAALLVNLANEEHKSVARLVRELTIEALELREDLYFSTLADKLDVEGATFVSHDEAWK